VFHTVFSSSPKLTTSKVDHVKSYETLYISCRNILIMTLDDFEKISDNFPKIPKIVQIFLKITEDVRERCFDHTLTSLYSAV